MSVDVLIFNELKWRRVLIFFNALSMRKQGEIWASRGSRCSCLFSRITRTFYGDASATVHLRMATIECARWKDVLIYRLPLMRQVLRGSSSFINMQSWPRANKFHLRALRRRDCLLRRNSIPQSPARLPSAPISSPLNRNWFIKPVKSEDIYSIGFHIVTFFLLFYAVSISVVTG